MNFICNLVNYSFVNMPCQPNSLLCCIKFISTGISELMPFFFPENDKQLRTKEISRITQSSIFEDP